MKAQFTHKLAVLTFVVALAATALVGATDSGATDQPAPPSLASENMGGTPVTFSESCNPDGTSTISFSSSGMAFGPYPGTYSESGTITIGPDIATDANPPIFEGVPLSVDVTFRIDAVNATITGTKSLFVGVPGTVGLGTCKNISDSADFGTYFCNTGTASGRVVNAHLRALYSATIVTGTGAFRDSGNGTLNVDDTNIVCSTGDTWIYNHFGEFFIFSDGVTPAGPAAVTLTPPDAVNNVGTSHTVTANVTNAGGGPVQATTVLLNVQGSVTTSGSCTTDVNGQCSFTYTGPQLPGADLITGCADSNGSGAAGPGEPCGTATKAWVLPTSTPGQVTGGGQVMNAVANDQVAFGFNAKSSSTGIKGECTVVDPSTNTKLKCLDATILTQSGTHGTFFGNATVNGTATTYRIDVDDLGEPGKGKDTFKIQTASGYTASGVIVNGNIQVH